MGNYFTYCSPNSTGKVILSDGRVHEFETPPTAAELMLEYPQQVVVEFHSRLTEKRPIPLPADKKLEIKKLYLMLPMKRGKPPSLSTEEARHVIWTANYVLRSRSMLSASRFLPLFAKICPAGIGEELERQLSQPKKEYDKEEKPVERCRSSEFSPDILDSTVPEYLSRQISGKGWKPSLDTIKEKQVERKVLHWLF
ncbi:hypothetical protein K2173_000841 [Erythroxylum novogranatense]|uniref:Uncharacterized protein n=1 Tax=Erythroxylum novogranatense TaxID=1862640 RepID=A0AAV8S7Y8_9ROSI|nr:hypothetical protein K2173_000841 [Erythroxylum novogranatense]